MVLKRFDCFFYNQQYSDGPCDMCLSILLLFIFYFCGVSNTQFLFRFYVFLSFGVTGLRVIVRTVEDKVYSEDRSYDGRDKDRVTIVGTIQTVSFCGHR